jgi:hypothetical protein
MFAMSSTAVEHELAYRRHELEKAAARTEMVHRAERDETGSTTRASRTSWWRRVTIAH